MRNPTFTKMSLFFNLGFYVTIVQTHSHFAIMLLLGQQLLSEIEF